MECEFRKVTALVRTSVVEAVEKALQAIHVKGVSVTRVKGYGEYANFFSRDWMVPHARLEIFTCAADVPRIVEAILSAASTGLAGDGIVCVLPVEQVWRIRSRSQARPEEL